MQQKQKIINSPSNDQIIQIKVLKDQNRRLKIKLAQYEKKLILFKHQQQKIKELQKANNQNSTRLLQCVSNVRDLLHSNKNLREELEREKKVREEVEMKLKISMMDNERREQNSTNNQNNNNNKNSSKRQSDNSSPLKSIERSIPSGIVSIRSKNHRLSKLQKLAKMKISSKRMSTDNFSPQSINASPVKKHTLPQTLKALAYRYQISPLTVKQEYSPKKLFSSYSNEKNILHRKSLDQKKSHGNSNTNDQQIYKKAKLKRLNSLKKSQQKTQQLQYYPK